MIGLSRSTMDRSNWLYTTKNELSCCGRRPQGENEVDLNVKMCYPCNESNLLPMCRNAQWKGYTHPLGAVPSCRFNDADPERS